MDDYNSLIEKAVALTHPTGDYVAALALWDQAFDIQDSIDAEPSLVKAELLQNSAICACQLGQFDEAIDYCEKALEQQQALVDDWGDDVQRTLGIYVDAATACADFAAGIQASDLALSALAENPDECEPYTFAMTAQKRAYLALQMEEPEAAEGTLKFALEQLDRFFEMEDLEAELEQEVWLQKSRVYEFRAENRLVGGAEELGESDISEAIACLEKAGFVDGEDVERLQGMRDNRSSPNSSSSSNSGR